MGEMSIVCRTEPRVSLQIPHLKLQLPAACGTWAPKGTTLCLKTRKSENRRPLFPATGNPGNTQTDSPVSRRLLLPLPPPTRAT